MKNSLPRSVLFGFLSWLLPLGLTFVGTPLVVHGLGAEDYGIYTLVLGFISYSFAFNIGRAVTKYVAEYHSTGQTARINEILSATFVLNFIVGAGGALVLILFTQNLVADVLQIDANLQAKATIAFYLGAAALVSWMTGQVFASVLQALNRFDLFSLIAVSANAAFTIVNIVLVLGGFGLIALLWWTVAINVASGVIYFAVARKLLPEFRLSLFPSGAALRLVGTFSAGVVAYQIISNAIVLFERSWITRSLGAKTLTYYVVPMMLAAFIHSFISSFTVVLLPLTSEVAAQENKIRLQEIYMRTTKYICLIVAFIGVTMAVTSREFLNLWLGAEFAERSTWIFVFHIFHFSLLSLAVIAWQMSDGLGFPERNAWLALALLSITAPIMIWLTPEFGATGAAAAKAASVLTVPIFVLLLEKAVFDRVLWRFWGENLIKLFVAGSLCGAAGHFALINLPLNWFGLIFAAFFGGLIFLAAVLAIKYLNREERLWCESFMKRLISVRA
jgi:O-antigen/teichoic acid export membrane protein